MCVLRLRGDSEPHTVAVTTSSRWKRWPALLAIWGLMSSLATVNWGNPVVPGNLSEDRISVWVGSVAAFLGFGFIGWLASELRSRGAIPWVWITTAVARGAFVTLKLARISFDLAMVSAIENDHVEVGRTIGWFTGKFGGTVAPAAGAFAVAFAIGARRTPMLPRCLAGVGGVLGVAAAVTGFAGGVIVFVMGMVGGAGRDRDLSSHPTYGPG